MIQINTCCGCFTLRTGCLIIAVLGIIGAILYALIMVIGSYALQQSIDENHTLCGGAICTDEEKHEMKTVLNIVLIIYLVACAISLLVNILLVIGVVKKKTVLMCVWLVIEIISILGLGYNFIQTLVKGYGGERGQFGTAFVSALEIILAVYFILVVLNFRERLLRSSTQPAVAYTACDNKV